MTHGSSIILVMITNVRCNTGPGHNGGPCGPAPCTGECGPGIDHQKFIQRPCGCIGVVGEPAYDIHDQAAVSA